MNSASILIIDDEVQIRKLLTITLESQNYHVQAAANAKEGLTAVANHPPDLVLLDLYTNPIIILSVQSTEEDIVKALDNGANDYLIKPFRTGELMARIRSALRKALLDENNPLGEFDDVTIDYAARVVKKDGVIIKLTATEYTLLALMAKNEGKVLTHQYLLNQVWGPSYRNESQYLRVFVAQLRKKIETDPNRPVHITTESRVGYRFVAK
jgi:two-component system KDP operon response regulator KdpE